MGRAPHVEVGAAQTVDLQPVAGERTRHRHERRAALDHVLPHDPRAVVDRWAALLTWKWVLLKQWIFSLSPANALVTATNGAQLSITFFLTILVLSSMTVALALHTIRSEERRVGKKCR